MHVDHGSTSSRWESVLQASHLAGSVLICSWLLHVILSLRRIADAVSEMLRRPSMTIRQAPKLGHDRLAVVVVVGNSQPCRVLLPEIPTVFGDPFQAARERMHVKVTLRVFIKNEGVDSVDKTPGPGNNDD